MGFSLKLSTLFQFQTKRFSSSLKFSRNAHHISAEKMEPVLGTRQFEEIQIKVPWGHVAGKWWGTKTVRPIIGMHGWQDNAGTFDTLAPLLPDHVGFLAIDLPGHGLSSRIPNGLDYTHQNYIYTMHLLMKEYNWDKLSIIAHSMSSGIGFVFSALFPDKVDMLIGFDMLKPVVITEKERVKRLAKNMEGFTVADERNIANIEPPSYPYEEIKERFYLGLEKSVDREKCYHILDRNIQKSSKDANRYYFHRDNRLRYGFSMLTQTLCVELANSMQPLPHLFFKASNSPYYEDKNNFSQILGILKEKNPLFEHHIAEGSHHVHLNNPEIVIGTVNDFINKHRPPQDSN